MVRDNPPRDNEVEIEVKAAGLDFTDLMVAAGQITCGDGFGSECSGIVTKAGKRWGTVVGMAAGV